uniref:Nucleoporin Nup159/Nup146 N-terminal domain-containing protein n=1 Tax=Onchocerca volvulus TaxID=6282 RepID=A0A8R1XS57_ONCVO
MVDAFIDVPGFQFRALQRVRIFNEPDAILYDSICPSWITVSSRYGIIVCASGYGKLISLRTSDVHRLNTIKTDINVEVTDIQTKITNLQVEQPAALVALSCNCSGRVLSVSMRTASGAFVYLYDMCAFAVDCVEQRGPVYSLRLSADPNAQPCAFKWNPQQDAIFAKSCSITLVGTIKHNDMVTCIEWSPKGKQLIVGDISGYIKQYKPEMILVRVTPPPTDIVSLKDENALRCVGISWLATTDFLIAYSSKTGQKVNISKLCVKKDAPPQWTHFDDINFCGDKSTFDQRVEFTQLMGWKLVLCSSSRSSEVAVLGKIDSEWKVWTLDDNGRIEMPLDAKHCETYPVGISIDVSSILPVKIGEEGSAERPPCPIVLVLSSQGVLLAFNALSSRAGHQNINIKPESLPSEIYGTILARDDVMQNEHSCKSLPDMLCQTIPVSTDSLGSLISFKSSPIPKQNALQLKMQGKTNTSQTMQAATISKLQELLPCNSVQDSTFSQQQIPEHLQHQQLKTGTHLITELQKNFREKLVIFDKQFFGFCEQNDWLQNLKKNSAKQLEWNNGINLDDEMLELEKVRTVVVSWLNAVENQVKESMCSIEEQLGIVNSTDREVFDNGRILDFNNMHRLDKLTEALTKLEQKVANVEDALLEMPTYKTKNRSILTLDIDQEQQIATTAKSICKGMVSRRKALCELQQRVTSLSTQLKLLKKDQRIDKFFTSTRSSFSNSLLNYQTNNEELRQKTAVVTTQQQRELLRFLTQRGPVKQSEAKIVPLDIHIHEADEGISNSTITNIENRLLEAALMPIKAPARLVMDIGTQSFDHLFSKDLKSPTDVAVSIPIIPTNFMSNETVKSPTAQFNQFQKIAESDVKSSATLSSSSMNLNSSTTAVPNTSNSFATNAITKQFFAEKSSANVPETVALSQEQPNDITFSFKNLDTPLTARNDGSPRETDSCTIVTPSKSDYTSAVAQEVFSTKSSENQTASIVPAATSESLTNTSVTIASNSTTTNEIGRVSIQNSEISKTGKEMAVTNSSSASTTTSKTSDAEKNISFTFKLPEAENQQTTSPPTGGSVGGTANMMIEPQSKDLDTIGDEGMMEAEGTSTAPTALFSSSLSFGLGSAVSNHSATQNVFGSGLKFLSSAQSQTTSLFGNTGAGNKGSSIFDAGGSTTSSNSGGLFSRTQQSNGTSSISFSFSSLANSPNSSNLFGTKPMSSGTTFGGAPSFGSKPVFGSPSPLASAFGQQRSQHTPTTTAFSSFAKTSTVGFGSLAASQQQQSSSSVFGGSGFGALAQQPQKSSIFGGGLNSSVTNSSSFSTWR